MKVGQKVYLEPTGNASRYSDEVREDVVSKVGRKYFKTEGKPCSRFFLDTLKMDGGQYTSDYKAYLSLQDYEDKKEAVVLSYEINKYFSYSNSLSLDKLRDIDKIIKSTK